MSVQAEKKGALIYAHQQTIVLFLVLYHRKKTVKQRAHFTLPNMPVCFLFTDELALQSVCLRVRT